MGEERIAEEDKWMLEVNTTQLRDSTPEEQHSSGCMQLRQPGKPVPALWS